MCRMQRQLFRQRLYLQGPSASGNPRAQYGADRGTINHDPRECPDCEGSGYSEYTVICETCEGQGIVEPEE